MNHYRPPLRLAAMLVFVAVSPLAAGRGLDVVYIRADSLAPWGPVLKVIATVAQAEVGFSVVGEPYSSRR